MKYKIKEFRIEQNLTQEELAAKVGCSRQYINELENTETRNVSSSLLVKIATALNKKVDDLFLGS